MPGLENVAMSLSTDHTVSINPSPLEKEALPPQKIPEENNSCSIIELPDGNYFQARQLPPGTKLQSS